MECLLEEMRIKLASVLSDLLGVSGLRILWALARGESDPKKLAALGEERLRCSEEQLNDALTGSPQPMHRQLLSLQLQRLQLIDAAGAEPGGPRCGQEERQLFPSAVPASAASTGL